MSSQSNPELITLDVKHLIFSILGDDNDGLMCRQIHPLVAQVLAVKLKDSNKWIVEFSDREGKPHIYPVLWRYAEWKNDSETYARTKLLSERRRQDMFIRDANETKITKALMRNQGLDEHHARNLARNLLLKGATDNVLEFFGIKNLIKSFDELTK